MARYSKNPNQPSAEDRALDKFTELMIDKIKSINQDWQKPWFTEGALAWPRNLNGRQYNGGNAVMLMLHAEKEGYKLPVWCTFNSIQKVLNPEKKGGQEQEPVHVMKGEKSFPVFLTTFTVIDKDTHAKIPWEDYKKLSQEEKKQYTVYPKNQVFNVFNVAQTNLQEVRPELYAKLEEQCNVTRPRQEGETFSFPTLDAMIENNAWVCPIKPEHQDKAYYSLSKDHIVVPTKEQFVDGESFYGTLLHEMTHSTGSESRLNRLKPASFGDDNYGREELVAELGAALVCQQNGIQKHVKGDSAAYLKSWLDSLEESPEFIRTVMSDVKKATAVISFRMQEVQQQLDNGLPVKAYNQEEAIFDPTLVTEAPFKEQPKIEEKEEIAAMGVPPIKGGFKEVDVMGLFGALKRNGEARLSDHIIDKDKDKEPGLSKTDKENIQLMKQFEQMKKKHPDSILLFRRGDFYETFKEDAVRSAGILGLNVASREVPGKGKIELAGFPHHYLDPYLPKLVRAGCRVAICEMLEDPKIKKSEGVEVRRGIPEQVPKEERKREENETQSRGRGR